MKRQKPSFKKDYWDEFTPWWKKYANRFERIQWKRLIKKEKGELDVRNE